MNFAFFSANLHHYVSTIPWEEHMNLYTIFKKYHTARDPTLYSVLLDGLGHIQEPGILVAFHLGQHELIPLYLADAGLVFDILISKTVFERYKGSLVRHQGIFDQEGRRFNFIFAEDKHVLFSLRKTLREGRHLLIFADGNLGTTKKKSPLLSVDFFAGKLNVRTGAAFLSYILQVPIYPILDELDDYVVKISIRQKIAPNPDDSRKKYIAVAMQHLFDLLSDRLKDCWMNWACWDFLHHNEMLSLPPCNPVLSQDIDYKCSIVFKYGHNDYLLDRFNYNIFVI